jgi:hypothetical protein
MEASNQIAVIFDVFMILLSLVVAAFGYYVYWANKKTRPLSILQAIVLCRELMRINNNNQEYGMIKKFAAENPDISTADTIRQCVSIKNRYSPPELLEQILEQLDRPHPVERPPKKTPQKKAR